MQGSLTVACTCKQACLNLWLLNVFVLKNKFGTLLLYVTA